MKKKFKAESKKLLDMMINSIYTNREIFLRELISNSSDALDKLYYKSLTDSSIKVNKKDLNIRISVQKDLKTLTISDNGCGMSDKDLENYLGVIAQSDSYSFKQENSDQNDVNLIGQFGVGFYSSFMVSSSVEVLSRPYGSDKAYLWKSDGVDGYTIEESSMEGYGTSITLHLKDDTDDIKYSDFLEEYTIKSIIKKYSDYIAYPIVMQVNNKVLKEGSDSEYIDTIEDETLNSMVPLWKKNKKNITEDEYNNFYSDKFFDYDKPLKVIHTSVEGQCSYNSILFIPSHAPYDFYTKEYEKGLQLYSNGVLIMDKCSDLLPDYFNFVRGVVDTIDLSLNISRETLQQDRNIKIITKSIENKIRNELSNMLKDDFEQYKKFFSVFGMQIKFGAYNNYGMDKDKLKDLILFYSCNKEDFITLKDYVSSMKDDQKDIYYATGESVSKIDSLPQVELVKSKEYDILYLTDYVDEFVIQVLMEYDGKHFMNVSSNELDLNSDDDKKKVDEKNNLYKDIFEFMKSSLDDQVSEIKFTSRLKSHPVCLTSKGGISTEMEKVINAMPTDEKVKADLVLEINENHEIADKLKDLYDNDKDMLSKYTKVIYSQARLIEGLSIDNPTEISNLICEIISK